MNFLRSNISVVCPTYNSAVFVGETIASVIRQTSLPLEIIISDDGSTDNTIEVVKKIADSVETPVIKIVQNMHQGPGAARNHGIRAAQGEWIAFLDSDDKWHPEKIERIEQAIQQHPEVNFFCHNEYHRLLNGREDLIDLASYYQRDVPLAKQLFHRYFIATSAVVCKRDVLLIYNGFDETLSSAQDYELWLRMSPALKINFIPQALGWYIDRRGNISSKNRWRHLHNVLSAFSHNKSYVSRFWYYSAVGRYLVIFCKNQFTAFVAKIVGKL